MLNMNDVKLRDSSNGCTDVLTRTQEGAINRAAICRTVPQIASTLAGLLTKPHCFYRPPYPILRTLAGTFKLRIIAKETNSRIDYASVKILYKNYNFHFSL
jgi:hypothetical protein